MIIGDNEVNIKSNNGNIATTCPRLKDSMRSDIERMWTVGVVMGYACESLICINFSTLNHPPKGLFDATIIVRSIALSTV